MQSQNKSPVDVCFSPCFFHIFIVVSIIIPENVRDARFKTKAEVKKYETRLKKKIKTTLLSALLI